MNKSDSAAPEQDREKTEPKEPAAPPPGPPKSQLRRRVDVRLAELEAALARLDGDPEKRQQASAIRLALKGAHDTMNLSGTRAGHMEAAQMTRWLESTQYLLGTKS